MEEIPELQNIPTIKKLSNVTSQPLQSQAPAINILSFLTFTINPVGSYITERVNKIISTLKTDKPDVICLHLITPEIYKFIYSKIATLYDFIQIFTEEPELTVGTCIFLKKETIELKRSDGNPYYFDFENSTLSKKIIGTEIIVKQTSKKINLLTFHLENSEENDNIRMDQFNMILNIINKEKIKRFIMLSNFEIYDQTEDLETKLINLKLSDEVELFDAWIKLGCPGKVRNTYSIFRHDRILYTSNFFYEPISICLTCKDKIIDGSIYPSDHFGLQVYFRYI